MPRKKGSPKTGGRKKGVPNKMTSNVREALALLAQRNVTRLEEWLSRVAVKDPARAADLLLKALEFNVPKLSRSELHHQTGDAVEALKQLNEEYRQRTATIS